MNFIELLEKWLCEAFELLQRVSIGLATAFFGYFLPIRDFVHFLIFLLIVDMLFGYWANNKTRGELFMMSKFWSTTAPRMVVGVVLIMSAYLWDNVYHQETVETYRVIGWILSGATMVSIAQNGYKITSWSALNEIGNVLKEKLPKTIITKIKSK